MTIKAGGRVALIAVGLCVCVAGLGVTSGPSGAAPAKSENVTTGEAVKQARHYKRYVSRKHARTAEKPPIKANSEPEIAGADGSVSIPASVANANAAMVAEAPTGAAKAMTVRANALLLAAADAPVDTQAPPAENQQVVAADQLNDVDRTLQEQAPANQTTVALAPTKPVAAVVAKAAASDTSTWDQTSLIGKIFIAFGALLTVASAARMFMA